MINYYAHTSNTSRAIVVAALLNGAPIPRFLSRSTSWGDDGRSVTWHAIDRARDILNSTILAKLDFEHAFDACGMARLVWPYHSSLPQRSFGREWGALTP